MADLIEEEEAVTMDRRSFLRNAAGFFAATAAAIYVPKVIYSFPSEEPMGLLALVDDGTYVNQAYPLSSFARMLKEVYRPMIQDLLNEDIPIYRAAAGHRVWTPREGIYDRWSWKARRSTAEAAHRLANPAGSFRIFDQRARNR